MITLAFALTLAQGQPSDLEAKVLRDVDVIRRTSLDFGCDESLFQFWSLKEIPETQLPRRFRMTVGMDTHVSIDEGQRLEYVASRKGIKFRQLTAEQKRAMWSEEKCEAFAHTLLRDLRPGIVWENHSSVYDPESGHTEFHYLARVGDFYYRDSPPYASFVYVDALTGQVRELHTIATPMVRGENLQQGLSNATLRQIAVDVYSQFQPYGEARISLFEPFVRSARFVVNGQGQITERHRQIASAGEGMLLYWIIVQRLEQGRPTADYKYVVVDALTGQPLIAWEWPLESFFGVRGSASDGEGAVPLALDGHVRVAGSTAPFRPMKAVEKRDMAETLLVSLEYESGAIVKAEFDSAQSLLRTGETEAKYYTVGPELKAALDASIERRKKLPPWKKPDAPPSGGG